MVQVDVFWTYGLGASFGVAAHRQIHEVMSKPTSSPFLTPYYIRLLLFLSLLQLRLLHLPQLQEQPLL